MDVLYTMLTLIAFSSLAIFLAICFIMMTIFKGKSIGDSKYTPVKGTVFNQLFYFKKLYDYHAQLAKIHPTYRLLAPNHSELYTIDVRNIEHVLKTNFDKYSRGKYSQDIMTDLFGEGIFVVDGNKWKQQRKVASYEFSTRVLRDFSCSVFRKNAAKLVRVISEFYHEGLVFDMQDLQMRCALDSIFKVGFGTELNCLEGSSKEGTEFMKAFDESNALIYLRYVDPIWSLKRFLNIGGEAKLKHNVKLIDDFVNGVINTKKSQLELQQDSNVKEDILSRFLMESKNGQTTITDKYLRDIILNFMIAGKDTTANTLSWFFYMLCKNPLVEDKIVQEIKDVTCSHESELNNIDEFAGNLTDVILDKMHYLHAALTETLRLYPVVPIDGRTADAPDILPDGHKLEKGDGVNYLAYAMGRMSSIWGEDANEFRPERWINNGIFQPESPFKFVAFHAGPRMCLGKDFAYRQMKIVAMCVLNFFKFKLANGTQNVTYKVMFTLHLDKGLPLHAIPRS
ncbi:putative abieta-7,13-dien-18-ol hydroxylase [Medicago truncatula]|uniref:Cytochrome P450 family protein n=1 Tax=Medicago truncatula TaxID=3880 RepID=G7LDK2_MEDTR|nr:cytochrome P450 704C1 [Medicago truncatula]AET02149.1 cytochrome P450 family protein [Medicago truncatula]RHN40133.1 putative abieta-7,13-dien-18-ol hydroxylase [Medicago truncatula]